MRELRDMMNDFALIVQRQGDQLDTIEGNVDTAQDSVEAGQKHLQKAIQYSKKSRAAKQHPSGNLSENK